MNFHALLAASYKSRDTEENIDRYFTRPVGLVIALVARRLHIHPNAITLFSMLLGLASGYMFWHPELLHNIAGVLLLMAANFCDSADGQLARLTGQKTFIGRCLDGVASDVWFAAIYVAICLRLQGEPIPGLNTRWGVGIWLLCAVAGFLCHARQARLADYYRNLHLFFTLGREHAEFDTYDSTQQQYLDARERRDIVAMAFYYNYAHYCHAQEATTPEMQRLRRVAEHTYGSLDALPDDIRRDFCQCSRPLMKYANFLTHNWRAFTLFASCLAGVPWVYPLVEIIPMGAVCVYTHHRHEHLCRRLATRIRNRRRAYLFDYGGTLDTRGEHWSNVIWRAYQRTHVPITEQAYREAYVATERLLGRETIILPTDTFRQTLEKKIALQLRALGHDPQLATDIAAKAYKETLAVTNSSRRTLARLAKQGCPMALVSNFYGNLDTVLREFGLRDFFCAVIESAAVGIRKPDTRIWQLGIDALKQQQPELQNADIIAIGDSQRNDIEPAQALGLTVLKRDTNKPLPI